MTGSSPLTFGLVGCGRIGQVHANRIADDDRAEIAHVFDPIAGAAERFVERVVNAARPHSDFERFLNADLDAVIIASPTASHYEQAKACLARGWHLLCEKPLADSVERIEELIALAEASDRECVLGYQRRFWSTFRTVAEDVRQRRFGKINAVTYHSVENWQQTIAGTWRDDPAINWGGFVGDTGSHKVDGLLFATGLKPSSLHATIDHCGSNVPIVLTASGTLTDGDRQIPLAFDLIGNAEYLSEDFHIHCDEADLMIRDGQVLIAKGGEITPHPNPLPDSNPTIGFLDRLHGEPTGDAPFSAALPVREFTELLLRGEHLSAHP